jgi:hypothetical protein
MNLQVPPELEAKLTRLAAETGRIVDQVALDLVAMFRCGGHLESWSKETL